jgi:hypothetical protein
MRLRCDKSIHQLWDGSARCHDGRGSWVRMTDRKRIAPHVHNNTKLNPAAQSLAVSGGVNVGFGDVKSGHPVRQFRCAPYRTADSSQTSPEVRLCPQAAIPANSACDPNEASQIRLASPAAEVCARVIAARRPIPIHSFSEPCWIFGQSSHQFWRGTA